jgi:polyisoprenoid-binding protein YceI
MKALNKRVGTFLAAMMIAGQAAAQWELDSSMSSINFVSVKNSAIAENHKFTSVIGYIGEQGNVQLSVDLDSVDTLIPIRDERMRKLLFDTAKFPTANVEAQVNPEVLAEVAAGGTVNTEIPVTLSLHGVARGIKVPVVVFSDGGGLRVVSARPVLLSTPDFELETGVEALREVAGLVTISIAVPVTLNLQFRRVE